MLTLLHRWGTRRSSSPAAAAGLGWRSRDALPRTAPTWCWSPRPTSRTPNCPVRSTPPPRRSGTPEVKRYDLMQEINVRGTFVVTKACLPHLKRADNPHVLTLSPPLNLDPRWFGAHVAYTISKYNMSMPTLGWAEEFREDGIAFNSLWPRTMIATAAIMNLLGGEEAMAQSRTPEILADAAHAILVRPSRECSGNFFIDEDVLAEEGITELDHYRADPQGGELTVDLFLD